VSAIGRAAGEVLGTSRDGKKRALVGHDGRRSGPELEAALARGLASQGFRVTSAGLITTPGLALLTRLREFELGGMISASHNPAEDNGVKLFSAPAASCRTSSSSRSKRACKPLARAGSRAAPGRSSMRRSRRPTSPTWSRKPAPDCRCRALDRGRLLQRRLEPDRAARLRAARRARRAGPRRARRREHQPRLRFDAPRGLQAEVRRLEANLGIALDGDGDRCLLVDERGQLVDGDGILTIYARHAAAKWSDRRLVATVMSNKGLHKALREVGVGVITVQVGDRYVVEALERERLPLGGEQSGHIVFGQDNYLIGDGVYTALRVLRVMTETGQALSELAAAFRAFPQVLVNVRVARKPVLSGIPTIVEARAAHRARARRRRARAAALLGHRAAGARDGRRARPSHHPGPGAVARQADRGRDRHVSGLAVALETSTRAPSLAVRLGEVTLEAELASARAHASDLLPTLERLLGELGASPRDIAAVVVGTGPGSYTGLRCRRRDRAGAGARHRSPALRPGFGRNARLRRDRSGRRGLRW
jgi:phosphoglucosamine mutase